MFFATFHCVNPSYIFGGKLNYALRLTLSSHILVTLKRNIGAFAYMLGGHDRCDGEVNRGS